MSIQNSYLTVAASFLTLLAFVFAMNLVSHQSLSARSNQENEGRFDPLAEQEPENEEMEEQESDLLHEEDREQEGEDFEESHQEMYEVEFERMHVEANIGRIEMVNRLAEIAKDKTAMASYAIMQMEEVVEEEQLVQTLQELIESDQVAPAIKNLLRMKLAEAYNWQDQPDEALKQFKLMIMNPED